MPPATATSRSPARTAWSTMPGRAEARGADLVHGLGRDLLGDAALDLRLARGDLALAGLEHLAEDHVLDLVRRYLGALERGRDGGAAEVGGVERGEAAADLSERRAGGAEDHGLGHRVSLLGALLSQQPYRPLGGQSRMAASCPCFTSPPAAAPRRRRPPTPAWSACSRASRCPTRGFSALVDSGEAKPALKKVAVAHEDAPGGGQRRVLVAGLGKRDEFDAERARVAAAAAAAARAKELGRRVALVGRPGRRRRAAGWSRARCCALQVRPLQVRRDDDDERRDRVARGRRRRRRRRRGRPRPASRPRPPNARPRPPEPARRTSRRRPSWPSARPRSPSEHEALEVELLDREAIVARGMGAFAAVAQGTLRRAAPDRAALRRRRRGPAPRLRRQGRDLRHRRDLDQARRRRCRR